MGLSVDKDIRDGRRDGCAEAIDRDDTGRDQTTVGHVERMADGRLLKRAAELREEANAEMGGMCQERCKEGRRGGRLEEEDKRQRRAEQTIR